MILALVNSSTVPLAEISFDVCIVRRSIRHPHTSSLACPPYGQKLHSLIAIVDLQHGWVNVGAIGPLEAATAIFFREAVNEAWVGAACPEEYESAWIWEEIWEVGHT